MGIYINGMKMPTSCERCPMLDWDLDYIKCKVTDRHFKMTECWRSIRVPDCPLIPVQPHGRLIDADEFLKRAIGTKCFRGDYALMLEELVGESTTIIPADADEERREYDAQVESAKYCEMYEPTYDPETGAM